MQDVGLEVQELQRGGEVPLHHGERERGVVPRVHGVDLKGTRAARRSAVRSAQWEIHVRSIQIERTASTRTPRRQVVIDLDEPRVKLVCCYSAE